MLRRTLITKHSHSSLFMSTASGEGEDALPQTPECTDCTGLFKEAAGTTHSTLPTPCSVTVSIDWGSPHCHCHVIELLVIIQQQNLWRCQPRVHPHCIVGVASYGGACDHKGRQIQNWNGTVRLGGGHFTWLCLGSWRFPSNYCSK